MLARRHASWPPPSREARPRHCDANPPRPPRQHGPSRVRVASEDSSRVTHAPRPPAEPPLARACRSRAGGRLRAVRGRVGGVGRASRARERGRGDTNACPRYSLTQQSRIEADGNRCAVRIGLYLLSEQAISDRFSSTLPDSISDSTAASSATIFARSWPTGGNAARPESARTWASALARRVTRWQQPVASRS